MAFGTSVATDIANAALDFHVRGKALLQTMQERPLLAWLNSGKKTFPGGKQYITEPVQGAVMYDTAGFFAGFSEDDALTFAQASNILRAQYPWKEMHAGFVITFTELKKDGIIVTDGETATSENEASLTRLTGLLENRLADFSESWARAMNEMLWKDGSQDSKQIPGIRSLILDDPTGATTVGSLSQTTYTWWRNRASLNLAASPELQTLTKFLRNETLQLSRYGGRPNKAFCGSDFWDALMSEVEKKGTYTQTGFADKDTDVAIQSISIKGIGRFEYDPTLDTLGESRACYVMDSRRIKLRPMAGGENQTLNPARPYQYMLMLKSMVYTGGLEATQLNACAKYKIA
jgi:hypothetical protein